MSLFEMSLRSFTMQNSIITVAVKSLRMQLHWRYVILTSVLTVQELLREELKQLQARGFIENATIPDLGPLPQSSPVSARSDSTDESDESDSDSNSDEEDDEEDAGAAEEEEEDEYAEKVKSDSVTRTVRPRTRRAATTTATAGSGSPSADDKKEQSARASDDTPKPETEAVPRKRKRGRPPKIDTPEEARIRAILRAIRKVKDTDGRQLFLEFEKLPDPEQYPDYYKEIKKPIALDNITVWSR